MKWKMKEIPLLVFLVVFCVGFSSSRIIRIGGLFDNKDAENTEKIFDQAVEVANSEILTSTSNTLVSYIRNVPPEEKWVSSYVCALFKEDVAAIIGPQSAQSAMHVQSMCDAKEMPHIETRWDPVTKMPTLNVHPDPMTLSRVFVDLVEAYEWESFTILYENAPYLPGLSNLLKLYNSKAYTVTVRQLISGSEQNYRSVLRRVKLSEDKNVIIDCSVDTLAEVLKQAQQVGLMTDHHKFIVTSPDLHTLDLEPYKYSGANFTGIRFVDPDDERVKNLNRLLMKNDELIMDPYEIPRPRHDDEDDSYMTRMAGNRNRYQPMELYSELVQQNLTTEMALISDSVILLAEALRQLNISELRPVQLSCDNDLTWGHGYSLINYMKTSHIRGLTGEIRFDAKGQRTDFLLQVIELSPSGVSKIGMWNSTTGLELARPPISKIGELNGSSLRNKTFIVLTALSEPYGMLKNSANKLSGNDRYEGFGIDIIHELSQMLGFNYTFQIQNNYGSKDNVTQEWDGMVRDLLDYRGDLAITDLTITAERESAVDFTMPFMNLGISILYRKPTKEPPSLLSFMLPFSQDVWWLFAASYLGVSLSLFVLGRISPGEWDNPYPCIEEPTVLINQFRLCNCFWATIGIILQQGTDVAAKAASTRSVQSIWSFFTLIMVSTYTANLAAFLTIDTLVTPITSAEQLAALDGKIKYGAKKVGSTLNFFKAAEYAPYQKMGKFMTENPTLLTTDNNEGVRRVKTENYAYLMESAGIEYTKERECEVTQVGGLLDDKGYGIAMRKNSDYRGALSEGVLKLQEQGKLAALKVKWWKEKRGGGACDDANKGDDDQRLGMANVGGVFLVLLSGCGIAVFYGICEWYYYMWKRSKKKSIPFRDEFKKEAKFVMDLHNYTRRLRASEEELDNISMEEDSGKEA